MSAKEGEAPSGKPLLKAPLSSVGALLRALAIQNEGRKTSGNSNLYRSYDFIPGKSRLHCYDTPETNPARDDNIPPLWLPGAPGFFSGAHPPLLAQRHQFAALV